MDDRSLPGQPEFSSLTAFIESMPDPMLIGELCVVFEHSSRRPELKILDLNLAAAELLETTPKAARGNSLSAYADSLPYRKLISWIGEISRSSDNKANSKQFHNLDASAKRIGDCISIRLSPIKVRPEIGSTPATSADQIRSILDLDIADSLISINAYGTILSFNKAAENVFGWGAEEVIGKNVSLLMPQPFAGQHDGFLDNYRSTGTAKVIGIGREVVAKRKSGQEFPCHLSVTKLEIGGSCIFVGSLRDFSKEKELEQRAIQSQKMEVVGKLASGVSHDFNNTLGVVLGYAQLLLTKLPDDSSLRTHVSAIRKAAERGAILTKKLLAFSRSEPMAAAELDTYEAVSAAVEFAKRLTPGSIRVEQNVALDVGPIICDASQFEQVIINLIVNARDAIGMHGRISVRVMRADASNLPPVLQETDRSFVEVCVEDDGCGMDEETVKKAMQPFFTTKEKGKGTGLGLSMVADVARDFGGDIGISSVPGQGTSICVYLPVSEKTKTTKVVANLRDQLDKGKAPSFSILIVDDDDYYREVLADVLSATRYEIVCAESGLDAVNKIRKRDRDFDVVLTDIVMPEMDGLALYKEIRSYCPETKVFFMTGYTPETLAAKYDPISREQIFRKPFKIEKLLKTLHAVETKKLAK